MAIKYRDGWGFHALNGIVVPSGIALIRPNEITKDTILKQTNADYRRELVRKLSGEQLLSVLSPTPIDSAYGYDLVGINLGDDRTRPFIVMQNPSIEAKHIEGVSPECDSVDKALEFRNSRPGLPVTLDGFELFQEYLGDYFQQGDCLFSIESDLPSDAIKCNHNVVGEGLIRHIQTGGELFESNGIRYLVVKDRAIISHPEHKDTILTEGIYKISKVREYDHWLEESREVVD